MKLEKLAYSEFEGQPKEWKFEECTFGDVNLIVGKNATGKTRTLNVIRGLAGLLSDAKDLNIEEGNYRVGFSDGERTLDYTLRYSSKKVEFEELAVNGKSYLSRDASGQGHVRAEQLGQDIRFQTEPNRLAVVAKRDAIQHPFLDTLHSWASGVTRLDFGTPLGQDNILVKVSNVGGRETEVQATVKESQKVVAIWIQAEREYEREFKAAVLDDMKSIGYDLVDVGVDTIEGVSVMIEGGLSGIPFGQPTGTFIQEAGANIRVPQPQISQGMFRALSSFIQINYGLLSRKSTCLLIDDIGEGLDFSRSSAMVKRLTDKAAGSSVQLLMATNDRFIMNAVPLEYWLVLIREGGRVRSLNYRNSKEIFDAFQTTGLNNFDFFSSGYYRGEQRE